MNQRVVANQRIVASLDGGLVDPETPLLHADDLGVLRGDGLFETVLVVDGQPWQFEAHLARLARSAAMLDLPSPDLDAWRRCARHVIDAWDGGREMVLKLALTRGRETGMAPTGFAAGSPVSQALLDQRRDGIAVLTLEGGIEPGLADRAPWLLLGAKTLSYATNMAALRHAAARGADDVIFTASDGSVLEGPTSTVLVASGGMLRTPPPEIGILAGTTQRALFAAAREAGWQARVEPIAADELTGADGLWLISSIRLLARVHTLDGVPLPDPGLTEKLAALLDQAATVYRPRDGSDGR